MADVVTKYVAVHFDGHMGKVARFFGEHIAEHRDKSKGFPVKEKLMHVVTQGVPVDVAEGDDLAASMRMVITLSSARTH